MFIVTVYEVTGKDPVYVNAAVARSCLGFKNNKEDPFEHFSKLLKLKESFEKGNDITDAYTLAFWFVTDERGECQSAKKRSKKRKVDPKKASRKKER